MMNIWVISESVSTAAELVSGAKLFQAEVFVFTAEKKAVPGAQRAFHIPLPEAGLWESWAHVLAEKARAETPSLILVASSRRGKDLAAQMAALLEAPCLSDIASLSYDNGTWTASRLVYGGLAVKTIRSSAPVTVATGPRKLWKEAEGLPVEPEPLSLPECSVTVVERHARESSGAELNRAERVVCAGRGFTSEADLDLARSLCRAMDAELACSRPVAEVFHWLPEDRYVGISGQTIKPRLYVGCGVSGQIQHVSGMRDAHIIVAINKDKDAPIMSLADYQLIGDIKELLPALTEALSHS